MAVTSPCNQLEMEQSGEIQTVFCYGPDFVGVVFYIVIYFYIVFYVVIDLFEKNIPSDQCKYIH